MEFAGIFCLLSSRLKWTISQRTFLPEVLMRLLKTLILFQTLTLLHTIVYSSTGFIQSQKEEGKAADDIISAFYNKLYTCQISTFYKTASLWKHMRVFNFFHYSYILTYKIQMKNSGFFCIQQIPVMTSWLKTQNLETLNELREKYMPTKILQ